MEKMFELLKQDHRRVSQIINQMTKSSGTDREDLLDELTDELDEHMDIEETYLYPKLESIAETKNIIRDSYEEHKMVKNQLEKLQEISVDEDEWDNTLQAMKENIDRHVKQEETNTFPLAQKLLNKQQLQETNQEIVDKKAA